MRCSAARQRGVSAAVTGVAVPCRRTEPTGGGGGRVSIVVSDSSSFKGTVRAAGGDSSANLAVNPRGGTVYLSIPGTATDDALTVGTWPCGAH